MLLKKGRQLEKKIFSINKETDFNQLAIEIFHFQYGYNLVYKQYVDYIGVLPNKVKYLSQIPFMPIEFFKTHKVIINGLNEQIIFRSSGTTGINQSKHYVLSETLYQNSFIKAFNYFFGEIGDYCILALLPGYLEREGSSLVYMVEHLMKHSLHPDNGFYLNEYELLADKLLNLEKKKQKYLVIGVSYALLDFAYKFKMNLNNGIIMETGGMKGTRKELLKTELHNILKTAFNVPQIHSEYGMTELLTQAYSKGKGLFDTPTWMKILIRDTYDPFTFLKKGKSGGINVIDLANLYSCSFIETKDLGKINQNGQFEVLGRFDNSDIRGCNLLVN